MFANRRILPITLGLTLACVACVHAAGAGDRSEALREVVPAALEYYNELSNDPLPFLDSEQVSDLLDGEVVRIRRRGHGDDEGIERVTGYIIIRQTRASIWISALDPSFQASDWLTEVRLESDDRGGSLWYLHLDLPWPFKDRHWVIRLHKGLDIVAATDGLIWEQHWKLSAHGPRIASETVAAGLATGIEPESLDDAIYLPRNEGAWVLFRLEPEVTLIAYRVSAVVGGAIPDSWITTVAMAQLKGLLRGVEEHIDEACANYDPSTSMIFDGTGSLMTSCNED